MTEEIPKMGTKAWNDYVLDLLEDGEFFIHEEKDDHGIVKSTSKRPTCIGLRRIANELLGEVLDVNVDPVDYVYTPSEGRVFALVKCSVSFLSKENERVKKYEALSDVNGMNTDNLFLAYAGATAETRAEGRAWKKALMLRCLTAEETPRFKDVSKEARDIFGTKATQGEIKNVGAISDKQKVVIKRKCSELGIDLYQFLQSGNSKYSSVDEISKDVASKMIDKLNKFAGSELEIPAEIKERV